METKACSQCGTGICASCAMSNEGSTERMEDGANPPQTESVRSGWWCLTCKAPARLADPSCAHRHRWQYSPRHVADFFAGVSR